MLGCFPLLLKDYLHINVNASYHVKKVLLRCYLFIYFYIVAFLFHSILAIIFAYEENFSYTVQCASFMYFLNLLPFVSSKANEVKKFGINCHAHNCFIVLVCLAFDPGETETASDVTKQAIIFIRDVAQFVMHELSTC